MTVVMFVVAAWLFCAVIVYGWTVAYFWHRFPTLQDPRDGRLRELRRRGLGFAAFGPLMLVWMVADREYRYGWKL